MSDDQPGFNVKARPKDETPVDLTEDVADQSQWPIFDLISPSEPYTFVAPDVRFAAAFVAFLGTGHRARQVDPIGPETPRFDDSMTWFAEQNIDPPWIKANTGTLADVGDSLLIGTLDDRREVAATCETLLDSSPDMDVDKWLQKRHSDMMKSGNDIKAFTAALVADWRKSQ